MQFAATRSKQVNMVNRGEGIRGKHHGQIRCISGIMYPFDSGLNAASSSSEITLVAPGYLLEIFPLRYELLSQLPPQGDWKCFDQACQCWFNVGPPSTTLADQHQSNIRLLGAAGGGWGREGRPNFNHVWYLQWKFLIRKYSHLNWPQCAKVGFKKYRRHFGVKVGNNTPTFMFFNLLNPNLPVIKLD